MSEPSLSVIVPTYNRKAVLRKTLNAYLQSDAKQALEILIVDDGSSDGTGECVSEIARSSPVPIRYFRQENSGLAAARNRGIREAKAGIVLLGDDDIIPTPSAAAGLLAWHRTYPDPKTGVVGNIQYSPEVNPTPFQQWWGQSGVRYRPPCLFPGCGIALWYIQFGFTSLKRSFLQQVGPFNEQFRKFGHEDNEYAYRFVKAGGTVLFNPEALAHHYKRVTFSQVCRSVQTAAESRRHILTTEAGAQFLADHSEPLRRRDRIRMTFSRYAVPILAPLKPLLDTQIPLPGKLYSAFYTYYVDIKSRALIQQELKSVRLGSPETVEAAAGKAVK